MFLVASHGSHIQLVPSAECIEYYKSEMTSDIERREQYLVVENPDQHLSIWEVKRQLPAGWSATGFSSDRQQCLDHIRSLPSALARDPSRIAVTTATGTLPPGIWDAFLDQAQQDPDALAIVYGDTKISYDALMRRAASIGAALPPPKAGRQPVVAVLLDRSPDSIAAMLAAIESGAAILPLDPSYPQDRIAYMLRDADVETVLTTRVLQGYLPNGGGGGFVAVEEILDTERTPQYARDHRRWRGELAYVIYTSGSTGQPKGVMCTQAGIMNRLEWMRDTFEITNTDRILHKTPISFDVSVWEIFLPLISGASCVLAKQDGHLDPDYLAREIYRHQVSVAHFLPSMLQRFIDNRLVHGYRHLRHAFCGGETLHRKTVSQFLEGSTAALHNVYGPTEASIGVTCWDATLRPDGIVPVGRPIRNVDIRIMTERLETAPEGQTGEIFIGGVQLAKGYLKRPELTAERFVPDPDGNGSRLYSTGDLGRWSSDGNIEFLGRRDNQRKVRGYRVELDEIEAVLMTHPLVLQAVTIVSAVNDTELLIGYVAAPVSSTTLLPELLTLLRAVLPHYMIPSAIEVLPRLPLEPNGKISRSALPSVADPVQSSDRKMPRDDVEAALAGIFESVLDVSRISTDADFFLHGGTSLKAATLINRVNSLFKRRLPVRAMFEYPTVAALASLVRSDHSKLIRRDPVVPLKRGDGSPPLFCVSPVGGSCYRYIAMANHLPASIPVYGLQAFGLEDGEIPERNVSSMASGYLSALLRVQPIGPYRLLGWSFGGLVAFEIARLLVAENKEVELLALLDTPVPVLNPEKISDVHAVQALAKQILGTKISTTQIDRLTDLSALIAIAKTMKIVPEDFSVDHADRYLRVVRTSIEAGRNFRPQSIDCEMLFIRATRSSGQETPSSDRNDRDWSRYLERSPQVIDVACTHLDLGQPEMGETVARILTAHLTSVSRAAR